jgi:hypothetical protein
MVDTCTVSWTARDFQFVTLAAARLVFIPRDALSLAGAVGVLYVPARAEATSDGSGAGSIALVPGYYILHVITADGTATAGIAVPNAATAEIGACIDQTLDLPALSEFQALVVAAEAAADAAAASALAAATFDPALYLAKSGNLSGLLNTTTALTNLGATATGASLFTAATAAAARTTLGATAVGDAVFTAASTAAAQTAIGASVVGAAVLTAVDAAAARTALAAAALAGPTFTGQVKVASGTVGAPSLIQAGDVDTGLWFPAANTLAVSLAGAEKARFDGNYLRLAAGGIQFNGDTADANSLDDYEEGSFTSGAGVSGAGTYTLQTGRYVKVGKVVTIWGAVTITAHTGSGQMIIGGLPFTTANVANMKTVASILYLSLTVPASSFAVGFIGPNESWISMNSLATAATGYVSLSIDAACTLNFTATYEAA